MRIHSRSIQSALLIYAAGLAFPGMSVAAETGSEAVTFSKDVAPILQRSCQNCHNDQGLAPMALVTYKDARPWAKSIKTRTALRDKRGRPKEILRTCRRPDRSGITRSGLWASPIW
jgi:hypothetical protein